VDKNHNSQLSTHIFSDFYALVRFPRRRLILLPLPRNRLLYGFGQGFNPMTPVSLAKAPRMAVFTMGSVREPSLFLRAIPLASTAATLN